MDSAKSDRWTFIGRRDQHMQTYFIYGKVKPQRPEFALAPVHAYSSTAPPGPPETFSSESNTTTSKPKLEPRLSIPLSLWHQQFAYLNAADLKRILSPRLYVNDMPSHNGMHGKSHKCKTCMLSKAKTKFQRKYCPRRTSCPLEQIHSDMCGPIKPASRSHY